MDRKGFWALSPLALSVQIEDNEQRQTRKHRTKKNKKRKLVSLFFFVFKKPFLAFLNIIFSYNF